MENILIVDAASTGKSYILDIVKRGYHPVVLFPGLTARADAARTDERAQLQARFAPYADFYGEKDTYEETLALVRKIDPMFILPGGEEGIALSIRLSEDLGLPGNPYSRIDDLTDRVCMQEALKKAGLRVARGRKVRTAEEALCFYREEKLEGCVVKPLRCGGSAGVYFCADEADLNRALEKAQASISESCNGSAALYVQERIRGTEYIVNTVSYAGVHRLSSVWKCEKKAVEGGSVSDYIMSKSRLETGDTRMIRYAYDAADALGVRFGALCGEYIVDEQGPVLTEASLRVMDGGMPDACLDQIYGHHETDQVLDAYLSPEWHREEAKKSYRTKAQGAIKFFIVPQDMHADAAPVMNIIRRLRSYQSATLGTVPDGDMKRTVDRMTTGGTVYLAHEKEEVLRHDLDFIRKVENEYYDMLFSRPEAAAEMTGKKPAAVTDVMKDCGCGRSVLVLTNDPDLSVDGMAVQAEEADKAPDGYDYGILDLNYRVNEDTETLMEMFYTLVSKVRRGGKVIVPERTYWHLPCGMESAEVLCESIGLIIEAPVPGVRDVVIATRA